MLDPFGPGYNVDSGASVGLKPVSMYAYPLRVREKMASYLSSLTVSMCA